MIYQLCEDVSYPRDVLELMENSGPIRIYPVGTIGFAGKIEKISRLVGANIS